LPERPGHQTMDTMESLPLIPVLMVLAVPLAPAAQAVVVPLTANQPPLAFVRVPGGTLPDGKRIQPFLLQTTEVTQRQWRSLLHSEPSAHNGCDDCPVESVNWTEAAAFANALSRRENLPESYVLEKCRAYPGTGTTCKIVRLASEDPLALAGYRLPTEAEWTFAARAPKAKATGTTHPPAWLKDNSEERPHPVAGLTPNILGLHDMSGNVWEWCHDVSIDPNRLRRGEAEASDRGTYRVVKGGSWATDLDTARPGHRESLHMNYRDPSVGFRLARTLRPRQPK